MSILYLLIPLAVVLMVIAVGFFIWTVKNGQYDDMDGPAHRILMDDDDPRIPHREMGDAAKDSALPSAKDSKARQPENPE